MTGWAYEDGGATICISNRASNVVPRHAGTGERSGAGWDVSLGREWPSTRRGRSSLQSTPGVDRWKRWRLGRPMWAHPCRCWPPFMCTARLQPLVALTGHIAAVSAMAYFVCGIQVRCNREKIRRDTSASSRPLPDAGDPRDGAEPEGGIASTAHAGLVGLSQDQGW